MYKGYLDSFYKNHPEVGNLEYREHYELLLTDSTEFVASYVNNFNMLGIKANCVIANDLCLQNKWSTLSGMGGAKQMEVIFNQVKTQNPDVLWLDDFHKVDVELLKRIKAELHSIRLIIGYHCSPYNSELIEKMKYTDFLITCTSGMKENFNNLGLKCYHVYHGFDTYLLPRIENLNTYPENSFIFSGTLLQGRRAHNERIRLITELLEADINLSLYLNLESNFRIKIKQIVYYLNRFSALMKIHSLRNRLPVFEYFDTPINNYPEIITKANRGPVFGIDMYRLLHHSGIVLNSHGEAAGNYCGNMRMFEATGAGACLLTENKINIRELFEPGKEVVVYDSPDDCVEKAKWLLENEPAMKSIAEAGQRRTLKDHAVEKRCSQMIEIIEYELKKR